MTKRRKRAARRFIAAAFVVLLLAVGITWGKNKVQMAVYPTKYVQFVNEAAQQFGLDRALIYAVIRTESSFDPQAVSHAGARGLMQMTSPTVDFVVSKWGLGEIEEGQEFDPQTNIMLGCWLLGYLQDRYGDTDTALCAYNAGMGNVSSWLKDTRYSPDGKRLLTTPYRETNGYVEKVNKTAEKYAQLYFAEQ